MTNNNNIIKLSNVRLDMASIMEPVIFKNEGQPDSKPTYYAKFILDKSKNLKAIEDINRVTDELLAEMKTSRAKVKDLTGSKNLPLKDGDITDQEHFKNSFTLWTSSLHKPQAFLKDGKSKATDAGLFYSGSYVNSFIQLKKYDKPCHGVKAWLVGIQVFKDGELISRGINLTGMFDSVDDEADDINLPF